jgi:hypothetical protein
VALVIDFLRTVETHFARIRVFRIVAVGGRFIVEATDCSTASHVVGTIVGDAQIGVVLCVVQRLVQWKNRSSRDSSQAIDSCSPDAARVRAGARYGAWVKRAPCKVRFLVGRKPHASLR